MASTGAEIDDERSLAARPGRSLLRFMTCGSVDDGKSTLIGRLLYDAKQIYDDQLSALQRDSAAVGTRDGGLDFALLLDGLAAEREQGITIDVAYRYFATERRSFIVADTPGHEQYTRNMVTGASTADLAVILVDARKGILVQTRRHSYLVSLMGIREVVLAINKMDLVDYDRDVFERLKAEYLAFADQVGLRHVVAIPMAAVQGENVAAPSPRMAWYEGAPLLHCLETADAAGDDGRGPFRMFVQWVNRPNPDFRGFSGTIAGGDVRPGDLLRVLPSGMECRVARIVTHTGDLAHAGTGQSITLTLDRDLDIGRGDLLSAASAPAAVADQFNATAIWMSEESLLPGRSYLLKIGSRTLPASVSAIKYKINVNSLEHAAAKTLELNEIGVVNVHVADAIAFDPYDLNRETGAFILIDRMSNDTVGAGLIHFALRRSQNVQWQALEVDKAARAGLKNQKACVLWFTGLSGAGKSTIANLVEKRLAGMGRHTYLLDGDNVRHGLNHDLGFTDADRVENIRRVAEVAKLMVDAGLIVLVSFISPFRAERALARDLLEKGEFIEIHVDTPLAEAEKRDPKGLYAKARRGEIKNFTGITSPYEAPVNPELRIDTTRQSADHAAEAIVRELKERGMLTGTGAGVP